MKQALIELAQRHMDKVRNRDRVLEKEQKDLEDRLHKIKAERDNFIEKLSRFRAYKTDRNLCPLCWVEQGFSSEIEPISGNEEFDKFKCRHCGTQLEVKEA